ncbi:hypothetical protein DP202_18005 [Enterobacter cloacae]|uniref:Uncharacterized protein n=1 Tax=Enterobacter cloacae TaxID=550 RepID=A0A330GFN2_ENTCL|nr:hypothetical protein DP202_18005 [Enterobacter cloacae]
MTLDVLFPVMNIISPHKFSAHANVHELIALLSTEKEIYPTHKIIHHAGYSVRNIQHLYF